MSSSLFQILNISKQDMMGKLNDLDVVSNNLANVNTNGFKSNRANFQELLSAQKDLEGNKLSSTQLQMSQGSLNQTGNPMDISIQGDGFFSVQLPDGRTGYTRDGSLHLDGNNRLETSSGFLLNWQGQIPQASEEIKFDEKGGVWSRQGQIWSQVGTIPLSRFINPTGLVSYGSNVMLQSAASGAAQTGAPGTTNFGSIAPQTVETANVNMSEEMTRLMTLERNFQMSTRTFQQTDEMISEALQMRK